MFDRFTDGAKKSLSLARQEALRLGHDCIAPEHMLVGVVQEGTGVAAAILTGRGIALEEVRREVGVLAPKGSAPGNLGQLPFTADGKTVLMLAMKEADGLRHRYIGAEHLLLGLLGTGRSIAAQVLRKLGLDLDAAREAVRGRSATAGVDADTDETRDRTAAVLRIEREWVAQLLPPLAGRIGRRSAFVMLPRGASFDELHRTAIEPGLRGAGIERVSRSGAADRTRPFDAQALPDLLRAEVLVAVTTGSDPEVLYPLGLCHGMGRCPLLLIEDAAGAAAQSARAPVLPYANDAQGRADLATSLSFVVRAQLERVDAWTDAYGAP